MGYATEIIPGDRVDLVLTQSVAGEGGGSALKTSETFVRNVRVLAVDQSVVLPEDDQGNKLAKVVATVTLESTPRIAEKIAVAQTIGQVSLSLRSIADNTAELERAIGAPLPASAFVSTPVTASPEGDPQLEPDKFARGLMELKKRSSLLKVGNPSADAPPARGPTKP